MHAHMTRSRNGTRMHACNTAHNSVSRPRSLPQSPPVEATLLPYMIPSVHRRGPRDTASSMSARPAPAPPEWASSITAGRAAAWGRAWPMEEVALSCIGLHATVGIQYSTSRRRGHGAAAAPAGGGRAAAPHMCGAAARRGGNNAPGGHRAGREGGGRRHAGDKSSEAEHFAEGTGFGVGLPVLGTWSHT